MASLSEALAFSCFTELMKRMNQNFPHGGAMDTHFANMRSLIQVRLFSPKTIYQNSFQINLWLTFYYRFWCSSLTFYLFISSQTTHKWNSFISFKTCFFCVRGSCYDGTYHMLESLAVFQRPCCPNYLKAFTSHSPPLRADPGLGALRADAPERRLHPLLLLLPLVPAWLQKR